VAELERAQQRQRLSGVRDHRLGVRTRARDLGQAEVRLALDSAQPDLLAQGQGVGEATLGDGQLLGSERSATRPRA
jgi:hypothetical protein